MSVRITFGSSIGVFILLLCIPFPFLPSATAFKEKISVATVSTTIVAKPVRSESSTTFESKAPNAVDARDELEDLALDWNVTFPGLEDEGTRFRRQDDFEAQYDCQGVPVTGPDRAPNTSPDDICTKHLEKSPWATCEPEHIPVIAAYEFKRYTVCCHDSYNGGSAKFETHPEEFQCCRTFDFHDCARAQEPVECITKGPDGKDHDVDEIIFHDMKVCYGGAERNLRRIRVGLG